MKKRILLFAIIAALALTGCTTVKTLDLGKQSRQPVVCRLALTDGRVQGGHTVQVRQGSTSWIDLRTEDTVYVENTQIETISCDIARGQRAIVWRRTYPAEPIPAIDTNDLLSLASDPPSFARINTLAQAKKATVTLADSRTVAVDRLQVTPDSTSWWRQDQFESVATAEIREIHFDRADRGVLVGALTGLASGVALGVLVSRLAGSKKEKSGCMSSTTNQSSACENCLFPGCLFCPPPVTVCTQWSYSEKRAMADAVGAFVGAGLAGLFGGAIGHAAGGKDVYRFEAPVSTLPVLARDVEQQIPRKQ